MIKNFENIAKLFIAVFASINFAYSAPVTWTFTGASFDDGTQINGTFTYDADTNTYSSWTITTQQSSVTGAQIYDSSAGSALLPGVSNQRIWVTLSSFPVSLISLDIEFDNLLTNNGGVVNIKIVNYGGECEFPCGLSGNSLRKVSAGTVVASVNQPPSAQPPGAPSIGVTTAGDSQASVAFTPPSSDGGAPITSYTATCNSSNGGVTGTGNGSTSPIVVTGLTNGKDYTCTVLATNSVGDSSASSASNSVTPLASNSTPPATPTPIPTLGEWAMIFMASLMAMLGIRRMRRSK